MTLPNTPNAPDLPRLTLPLEAGWRFHRGDPEPLGLGFSREALLPWLLPQTEEFSSYLPQRHARPAGPAPGSALRATQPDFDDSAWREVTVPHDWAIEGPFEQELPGDTGKLPWHGAGWYRGRFQVPVGPSDARWVLEVDGAMSHALVWVNGTFAGGWPYGYTSFRLDVTGVLIPGRENILAVRLDNPPESSRWYPGAGLYRQVRLVRTARVHLDDWATVVTTPRVDADRATVDVGFEVYNRTGAAVRVNASVSLHRLDAHGAVSAEPVAPVQMRALEVALGAARTSFSVGVDSPALWQLDAPALHAAVVTLTAEDGRALDRLAVPFGIRSLGVDADRGLLLNGRPVRLHGVCQHHDLGALGAAVHRPALERQLRILKDLGANAIRTSHNPPAPELLELCDRMGLLVQAEAFDAWSVAKKVNDYSVHFRWWHEADLRALVRRDRNHPCVVMWSIGNEISDQGIPDGWKIAARLAALVREEDRTRPVTAGFNFPESGFNGFETAVDVFGYNYKPHLYRTFRERHPQIPLVGNETASTLSSRGEYFLPIDDTPECHQRDFQVGSFDLAIPPWATTPDREFAAQDDHPEVLGEFVWTGFDYLGEPTPYNNDTTNLLNYSDPAQRERARRELDALGRIRVPARSSYFGIVDLAGFPKDRYYLYQARWRPDLPVAHLLPHWNGIAGGERGTPVLLYTNADEAELLLNGRSLGRKGRGPRDYRLRWDAVAYEPGELRAITWKNGRPWAEAVRQTTGPAARLRLVPERNTLRGDGRDLAFVTLRVEDADGRLVPDAKLPVTFSVEGPARILATDNGDPTDHTPFPSPARHTFNGLALVILKTRSGAAGMIEVKAAAQGHVLVSCSLKTTNSSG